MVEDREPEKLEDLSPRDRELVLAFLEAYPHIPLSERFGTFEPRACELAHRCGRPALPADPQPSSPEPPRRGGSHKVPGTARSPWPAAARSG
jgi:hypothetical protein